MTDAIYVELPPFHINQSRWKLYMDCPRLYGWFNLENIEPRRKRLALEIGSAIHKAMVIVHQKGGTQEAFEKATEYAEKEFRRSMATAGPMLPGDEEEIQSGVQTIQLLLPAYHQAHIGRQWEPLGTELAFCAEVGEGTSVFVVGRIDNLVTFMNGLWLVDYKTMGRLDMRDFLKYEIDIQLTAYIYGGTKQLSLDAKKEGKPPVMIRGAIIDGLVKTKVPQFHRELYTRTVEDLREFEVEFCMTSWEIASKHAMARGDRMLYNLYRDRMFETGTQAGWKSIFVKNTNQCFKYGTCVMRDLCVHDTPTRRLAYTPRTPDYVDDARTVSQKGV